MENFMLFFVLNNHLTSMGREPVYSLFDDSDWYNRQNKRAD